MKLFSWHTWLQNSLCFCGRLLVTTRDNHDLSRITWLCFFLGSDFRARLAGRIWLQHGQQMPASGCSQHGSNINYASNMGNMGPSWLQHRGLMGCLGPKVVYKAIQDEKLGDRTLQQRQLDTNNRGPNLVSEPSVPADLDA